MIKKFLSMVMSFILIFSLVSCSLNNKNSEPTNNDEPTTALNTEQLNSVSYNKNGQYEYLTDEYLAKLSNFSNKIYEMSRKEKSGNYVMSPLSIYMALAILHYIGDEYVKSDIEKLFDMTEEDINNTGKLFLNLIKQRESDGNIYNKVDLTNSIWFDTNIEENKNVLD